MEKNHRHKWKKVMLTSAPFAEGSYMWWCKKCSARALTVECPAEKISEEKPKVTEEWVDKKTDELFYHTDELFKWEQLRDFIRSLVDEIQGGKDEGDQQKYVDDVQQRRW